MYVATSKIRHDSEVIRDGTFSCISGKYVPIWGIFQWKTKMSTLRIIAVECANKQELLYFLPEHSTSDSRFQTKHFLSSFMKLSVFLTYSVYSIIQLYQTTVWFNYSVIQLYQGSA